MFVLCMHVMFDLFNVVYELKEGRCCNMNIVSGTFDISFEVFHSNTQVMIKTKLVLFILHRKYYSA